MRAEIAGALVVAVATAAVGEERVVLPVRADVGITSVRGKGWLSNGAGPTSAIRQNQNWSGFEGKTLLMDFDARRMRGWTVRRAQLHVTVARGELYGVGLCTVLSPWGEGRGMNWAEARGGACWAYARSRGRGGEPTAESYWAWPGSGLYSVSWAHPHARYSHAGPEDLKRERVAGGRFVRITVPVAPALVESLAAGVAYGLVMTDDKGQVAEAAALHGSGRPYRYDESQDTFVFTRDVQDKALRPVLEVFGGAVDKAPPGGPGEARVAAVSPSEGMVVLEFRAPGDDGMTGRALAYDVVSSEGVITESNWSRARAVPRWTIPLPVAGGQVQRMPIFTLGPGEHQVGIRGVDDAGNRGPVRCVAVRVPELPDAALAKAATVAAPAAASPPGVKDKLTVFACPEVVKIDPVSGSVLREGGGYGRAGNCASSNAVWRADRKLISLQAAANEVTAFKLIVKGEAESLKGVAVSVGDLTGPRGRRIASAPNMRAFRMWYVRARTPRPRDPGEDSLEDYARRPSGWHGDACLPLEAPFETAFAIPAPDNAVGSQRYQAVWVDVYVPRGTQAGRYAGKVTVSAEGLARPVVLNLEIDVLPIALPDKISWRIDLNRYGRIAPYAGVDASGAVAAERMYFQMAQAHRCTLNSLPYTHSSTVYGGWFIPKMAGKGTAVRVADWREWDARFGPLFDGSAFSARAGYVGPGADTPVAHIYLPFCEGWPVPNDRTTYKDWAVLKDRLALGEWAKTSRRLDDAFTPAYKKAFIRVVRQYFEHFKAKGWTDTAFQFYFNNKYYFMTGYFGGMHTPSGTCFWLLDEPVDFDDYDANRFFLTLGRRGYEAANAPQVKVEFRTDISQPEMTRGLWNGVCDLWNCSAMFRFAPTAALRRKWLPQEKFWHYGGGPGPSAPHVETMKLFLLSWCAGTNGELPYWNFGQGNWRRADNLATMWTGRNYAGGRKSYPGPIAGARLKILRRCQQDVEYLHLLARSAGWDRPRVRRALMKYADDPSAPVLRFNKLTLDRWIELRKAVAATIVASRGR